MEILGYSEEGLLSIFLVEVAQRTNGDRILEDLAKSAVYPEDGPDFDMENFTVLLGQSLSKYFGEPDVIFLVKGGGRRDCFFVEAKVKTMGRVRWNILTEFEEFRRAIDSRMKPKGFSSNLFSQLYLKARLYDSLRDGLDLQSVPGDPPFSEELRIGNHPVVKRALGLIREHLGKGYMIALIPSTDTVTEFHRTRVEPLRGRLRSWDSSRFGYLAIGRIEEIAREEGLTHTLRTFEHNRGQLY